MSKVKEFVDQALAQKDIREAGIRRSVSLRLGFLDYYRLTEIAATLAGTKTAVAQDLLSAALEEAYGELGLEPITGDVLQQFADKLFTEGNLHAESEAA